VAIGGYMAICAFMYIQQDALVYPGGTVAIEPLPAPDSVGLAGFAPVILDTPDGERLKAWWHPPEAGHGVVIYLHGNRQNIAAGWRVERLRDLAAAGFGVLGLEYRGFGGSSGHPSEPGLITDAETGYDFIAKEAPGARIAAFGDSLGTGVTVALATQRPLAGLVLDSPFASALRLAANDYGWLPTSLLLKGSWKSEDRIKSVNAPIFIAHCDTDRRIPLAEARRLFDTANQPKEFVELKGCGHVETWVEPVKSKVLTDFGTWLDNTR
jgi:pimeloyl-ACP methyl ester carboxylesterase